MLRPYKTSDLPGVLIFAGACLQASKLYGYHPGDVVHWMSNSQKGDYLDKTFWIFEQDDNMLALAYIPFNTWDDYVLLTHVGVSETLELSLLQACEDVMTSRFPDQPFSTNVVVTDEKRIGCLKTLGYTHKESPIVVDVCSLDVISESVLPEGFSIRRVAGEHEAGLLAEVHSSAFGSSWTGESYRKVMQTPGFVIERELVVVAPGGQLASFLVYWLDPVSQCGLFEPVGCHKNFQRKGLTKALMIEGMQHMKQAGMKQAMVGHLHNEAANKLYASVGFKEYFKTFEFVKHLG